MQLFHHLFNYPAVFSHSIPSYWILDSFWFHVCLSSPATCDLHPRNLPGNSTRFTDASQQIRGSSHFSVIFQSFLGIIFEPFLSHFWIIIESFLSLFWVFFESFLSLFWVIFESLLSHFWVIFESFFGQFSVSFRSFFSQFSVILQSVFSHF